MRSRAIDLLLTYYGDDFTGSTDALEALSSGGVETVLFVEPPTKEMLERYPHVRAFGIAGNSRAMSTDEMDVELPAVFRKLQQFGPKFVHYKVCSTFDSSPTVGSIGRALDAGHRVFQNRLVPVVAGVPSLGRYCVFGNLFARSGLNSEPFRLDRHPTMRRHPVTPMDEADLRLHFARQTDRPTELVNALALDAGLSASRGELDRLSNGVSVLFDTLTDTHLGTIGELLCDLQQHEEKPQFVLGSSGVDYALVRHWQELGVVSSRSSEDCENAVQPLAPEDGVVVLSGSCSPVTDRQISWALANGFAEVALDTQVCCDSYLADGEVARSAAEVKTALDRGLPVVVHTCRGPEDRRLETSGRSADRSEKAPQLGTVLGRILRRVLGERPVRRAAVVGGDTSGQAARALGVEAVEMLGRLEPGAPLCRVRSRIDSVDGLEITFKGGQVGYDEFFGTLLHGKRGRLLSGAMR